LAISYNQQTLSHLEVLLKEQDWIVRYERGNFQSGSCLIKEKKMVVINKFVPLEQKVQALIGIVLSLDITVDSLNPKSQYFFKELQKIKEVL